MLNLRRRLLSAALLFALAPAFAFQATLAAAQAKPAAAASKPAAATAKLDINTATVDQLKALPGIGDVYSQKIVAGRNYANKTQLTSKGILPQKTYDGIKDTIIAKQPAKK